MSVNVERDLDRILTLLRNKIREKGFTQLEVQNALNWGRSYISQLLTRQKSLRVEQILMILDVIGVEPAEFYSELYHFSTPDPGVRNLDDYLDRGFPSSGVRGDPRPPDREIALEELRQGFGEMRSVVRGLVKILVDKELIGMEELDAADSDLSRRRDQD